MSQAWEHLWQLGGGLPARAISLLHSHLLYQSLLHRATQHVRKLEVHDAAPSLVTLLAAKTRILSFVPVEAQLSRLSSIPATLLCREDLPLQELVLTGIDIGSDLDFLLFLLPCCKRLSVLKLGGNCSADVLEAASDCPLTVLHVSERLAWQPRMQEDGLAKILIGCEGALKQVLDDICQGKQHNFKPFWPDLIDLCTGWCKVSSEFLLLVLVAFPRLQQLRNQLIDTSIIVRRYVDLARQAPSLHNLSLKNNIVVYENFSITNRHFPNATRLYVFNVTDVERFLWELLEASWNLPHVHRLRLALGSGPAPRQDNFPPREQFILFGQRITELHIEGHHGGWIFAVLNLFPTVQQLRITVNALHIPEKMDPVAVFSSVSKLECVCHNSPQLLLFLAAVFPNLESLTLKSQCGRLALPWEQLGEMVRLRCVRLLGTLVDNISGLCSVPRDSSDRSQWQLCVRPRSLAPDELARLSRCGWTCFYV